jgi:hypothetical protein
LNADDRFDEEVAQVFGVPFEVVPFKATGATPKPRPPQRRIHAVPQKEQFAITVPRVLGYRGAPLADESRHQILGHLGHRIALRVENVNGLKPPQELPVELNHHSPCR